MTNLEQDVSLFATQNYGGICAALRKNCAIPFLVFICGLLGSNAIAATATGNPTSCVNNTSIGTINWTTPTLAYASDNAFAQAVLDGTTSRYLYCTGYGFAIPAGAVIQGITVNVERKSDRTSNGGSADAAVRLIKAGVIGTTDRATVTTYPTVDVIEAHGSISDLWGTTWTAADINTATFGVAFAATKPDSNGQAHVVDVDHIQVVVTYTPATTTLADGTNPSNVTIAPSGPITDLDSFTLVTSSGTDSATGLTVALAAGTSAGLSEVRITSSNGATTYYSAVSNPGSDTVLFSGGTPIPVTTAATTFKVRITPKTHAAMPVPPGSSYAVTGSVTAFTSANVQSGTDAASATVTVDNLSPANVTSASCAAGTGQVVLSWANPADADFDSVLVMRNTAAVADTPVEGITYAVSSTIGASTVACSTISTSCTDAGLTVGTAYHYRIFAKDSNGNYSATGIVPSGSPCTPASAVSSFNVVETGADTVTGRIFTKIAGQAISVDIVARDTLNAIATGFTGAVAVELVDNSGGGACAGLPLIKTLSNETFTTGNSGRHPLSAGQFEANAYRNVKFRIQYPTVSPTVTSCSSDAFANRPLQFANIVVRDQSRTTAGTTNTLDNTSSPGTGTVHNAGRPFRIDATAQNGAGSPATTTLYAPDSGQPVAVLSQCGVAAVCPASPGVVTTTGDYSASNGVITNATASYNDVGSFNLALEDRTFSVVDASDGTATSVRYIPSGAAVTVGRFVPDYFTLEAGSAITPRSDIGVCSGSSFTYMGEKMDLVFTLKARDSGNNITPSYAGATLGALVLNSSGSFNFGAIDSVAPTLLTSRLDSSLIATGATGSWSAGAASITEPLTLSRVASPDGPYTSLKIGIAPSDPDGVTLQTVALNLDADNSGTPERAQVGAAAAMRYGRLRLANAFGSQLLSLPMAAQTEYYNNGVWQINTADNCTTFAALGGSASALTLTPSGSTTPRCGVPTNTCTAASGFACNSASTVTSGNAGLCLTAPAAQGYVDVPFAPPAYLQFNGVVSPLGRASFGIYQGNKKIIYRREVR